MYRYKVSFPITPTSIEKVEQALNIKFNELNELNELNIYTCDDYQLDFSTDFWYSDWYPEDEPEGLGYFFYNSINNQYIYDIITKIKVALNQKMDYYIFTDRQTNRTYNLKLMKKL
jgi:hypothetical protein